jgi:SAF domain-containing protein
VAVHNDARAGLVGASGSDEAPASPPAQRLARARWLDARLLLGVVLVLGSVVVGAKLLAGADDTVHVWATTHELSAGTRLVADDVQVRDARLVGNASRYLSADGPAPVGLVLRRSVGPGELLPAAAVGSRSLSGERLVMVPVERFHLPRALAHGEQVDVYVTPQDSTIGSSTSSSARPRLVLAAAVVDGIEDDASRFGGGTSTVGVSLEVPARRVSGLVGAVHRGAVDLVRVPGQS